MMKVLSFFFTLIKIIVRVQKRGYKKKKSLKTANKNGHFSRILHKKFDILAFGLKPDSKAKILKQRKLAKKMMKVHYNIGRG